jgi:hypothetical protein
MKRGKGDKEVRKGRRKRREGIAKGKEIEN